MRSMLTAVVVAGALLAGAADVHAMNWGGNGSGHGGNGASYVGGGDSTKGSVPEPSTLYAIGSAVALLGGAGWYIRRRK